MKNGRAGTDMRAGFLFLYEGRKQHVVSVSEAPNVTKRDTCFAFESEQV